jgi:hypothetical protein
MGPLRWLPPDRTLRRGRGRALDGSAGTRQTSSPGLCEPNRMSFQHQSMRRLRPTSGRARRGPRRWTEDFKDMQILWSGGLIAARGFAAKITSGSSA